MPALQKINDSREGWRHPNLRVGGILVTKMDRRVRGYNQLLEELKSHNVLGRLICGVIPASEAVSYSPPPKRVKTIPRLALKAKQSRFSASLPNISNMSLTTA